MDPDMYTAAMKNQHYALSQYSADQFALQLTPNGNTLLHVAAEFNSSDCVPAILRWCPSLFRRANTDGDTPIHVAVARMNYDVVDSLIDFAKSEEGGGATAVREMLRARNHNEDTPLHLAARYDNLGYFLENLFMEEDPGFDHGPNKAGETPLYLYVDRGYDIDVLSLMLKTCTPLEYGGPSGRTALHAAVSRGKDKFLDKLIEWRNDLIKEPDAHGLTPLHYAADNGDVEVVQKLLHKDKSVAYVTANNDEGNTALHMATAKGHTQVMEELLSKCPDCWEKVNRKGRNILHISADLERDEATKYISEQPWVYGLVNRKDHESNTPMHVLAHKGNQNSFFRFSWAADVKALNNEALTPQDILLRKIGRKYWLLQKKFLRELEEKDQEGQIGHKYRLLQNKFLRGQQLEERMQNAGENAGEVQKYCREQKQQPEEGKQNAGKDQKCLGWLLQKKFLRGLDEKDQGGKGKMNSREQKEQPDKGKQNASEDPKGKMAERESEALMIVVRLISENKKEKAAEDMGKMAETHMIVATLISTITFAAGFTIPGGYHGEQGPHQGMAVLVREAAFKAFVISNTIALICSTSSVFLYISATFYNITGREGEKRAHRYEICFWLILTAMVAMMLAFSAGAYAVLAHSLGLAIATCVIACSSFIVYAFELKKHFAEEIAYAKESLSSFWVEFTEDKSSFWEAFTEDPFDFCRSCMILPFRFCCRCICFRED